MKAIWNFLKSLVVIGLGVIFYAWALNDYYGSGNIPNGVRTIGLLGVVAFSILVFRYFFRSEKLNWRSGNLKVTSDSDYKRWISQFLPENSEEYAVEFEDIKYDYSSPADANEDYRELLQKLSLEEKFSLVVGLVGLYGDGELSLPELFQLRKTIKNLNFQPKGLALVDRSDEELSLDEKLCWVISIIKSSFLGAKEFTKQELLDLFKALSNAIDESIEDRIPLAQRKQYFNKIIQALLDIVAADGTISKGEKDLIKMFWKSSKFK